MPTSEIIQPSIWSLCPLELLVPRFISPNLIHYNSVTSSSGGSSSWQITLQLLASTPSGPDTIGFARTQLLRGRNRVVAALREAERLVRRAVDDG